MSSDTARRSATVPGLLLRRANDHDSRNHWRRWRLVMWRTGLASACRCAGLTNATTPDRATAHARSCPNFRLTKVGPLLHKLGLGHIAEHQTGAATGGRIYPSYSADASWSSSLPCE